MFPFSFIGWGLFESWRLGDAVPVWSEAGGALRRLAPARTRRVGAVALEPAAVATAPPEHDLGLAHVETLVRAGGHGDVAEVGVEVAHLAAAAAHEMVMDAVHVGVETGHARAEVERGDLSHGGELVEGLVDGLERDGLHLRLGLGVDGLGRGMAHVAVEHPEDALALGGDLAALGAEQRGELFGGSHDAGHAITNDCFLTTVVEMSRAGRPVRWARTAGRFQAVAGWPGAVGPRLSPPGAGRISTGPRRWAGSGRRPSTCS